MDKQLELDLGLLSLIWALDDNSSQQRQLFDDLFARRPHWLAVIKCEDTLQTMEDKLRFIDMIEAA